MLFSKVNDIPFLQRSTLKISQISEIDKFFMGNHFQLHLTHLVQVKEMILSIGLCKTTENVIFSILCVHLPTF